MDVPKTNVPRLAAVAGPLSGATFPIENADLSIGRNEDNTVAVDDRAVSRKHCVIECLDGRYRLRDLGSHNLTYVNNLPVREQWLEDRDEIRVGRSIFLFLTSGAGEVPEVSISAGPESALNGATMILRREDALYLDPNRAVGQVGRYGRAARDLQCLLETADILCSERRLDYLADRLLELIAKNVPADSAAILLSTGRAEEAGRDSYVRFQRCRHGTSQPALPQGIIRRVMNDRISIWTNDAHSVDGVDIT
jgi:predicted component of type VI protein secretion system